MTKAVYAFSGDPITFGHIDIVERASKFFDDLVVAIGQNPEKQYTFTIEERLDLAKKSLSHLPKVKVLNFHGLLTDFAYENNIEIIVRGVRNAEDLNYEKLLFDMNSVQNQGIETCFFISKQKYSQISSSTVKEMLKDNALIHDFVPLYVKQKLEEKLKGQYFLSVTGEIGTGKTYISNELQKIGKEKGIKVHNIELDQIGHRILGELKEDLYVNVRSNIVKMFGNEIELGDGMIDRQKLGQIVFEDKEKLDKLNDIMLKPILTRLRLDIQNKKGLILLNAALTAESDISFLSNNNVVVISCDETIQKTRLKLNEFSDDQIKRRIESQFDNDKKVNLLKEASLKSNYGRIFQFVNNDAATNEIEVLFNEIINYFEIKS